jgi:hypothetical protein
MECGNQFSIAYDSAPGTRAERRARLHARFGFLCECPLCSLEGAELERSDVRQARMGELKQFLDGYDGCAARPTGRAASGDEDPMSVLAAVDEMLALQRQEDLPTTWSQPYQILRMQVCRADRLPTRLAIIPPAIIPPDGVRMRVARLYVRETSSRDPCVSLRTGRAVLPSARRRQERVGFRVGGRAGDTHQCTTHRDPQPATRP